MKDQFPIEAVPSGIEPWLLWGTSAVFDVSLTGAVAPRVVQSQQLAKVNYHRPETWAFLFTANILALTYNGVNPITRLEVIFVLQLGLGRSVFLSPLVVDRAVNTDTQTPFCKFVWKNIPNATTPDLLGYNPRWTTSVPGSPADDSAPTVVQSCPWFPAQDIQCSASLVLQAPPPTAGVSAKVEVGAYFAPRNHIRPDWWRNQFVGGELKGT